MKHWRTWRFVLLGMLALFGLIGGIGYWSTNTNISGAIVTSGLVKVEANRQVVQHPTGGVVSEILVKEGDLVAAGDVLIRLDDLLKRSELAVVEGQLYELIGQRNRLSAERDGADHVEFDAELLEASADNPAIQDLIAGQTALFEQRRQSMNDEIDQWHERATQIENQIAGAEAQLSAVREQVALLDTELENQQSLLDRGLTQAGLVSNMLRERADIEGSKGALLADIARSRGRIAETRIEIVKLRSRLREEAITALRELQSREIELRQTRLSLIDILSHFDIRAPRAGVVYGLTVFTERSVISPAEPIMYIIPQDTPLVIITQIPTVDIDQVYVGQAVRLRFSTFDQRTTPEINGVVTKISPDVFVNDRTGASYYTAELLPEEGELDKLQGQEILPGMPVEAFIQTEPRTPLQFLLKPLTDYFNRAFRG